MRSAALLLVLAMSSCALFGPSLEEHPRDGETTSAPATNNGTCLNDEATTLAPSTLFSAPHRASEDRPAVGSLIAFEGIPQARLVCTQLGCQFECCDNKCGADQECPYVLRDEADPTNEVCLAHSSFACGGSDCSPFCEPFSHAPKQRYRFVGRVDYRQQSLGQTPILRIDRFCVAQ
jgi:hypothetical protein